MTALELGVRLDDAKVRKLLLNAPGAINQRIRKLIEGGAIDFQRSMRMRAPVGVTGNYRRSIIYRLWPGQLRAEVWPDIAYAEDLENGTAPHYVDASPGSPLAKWAKLKGLDPYAVQHSIATKGTRPQPIVGRTFRKMGPKVEADIAQGISDLAKELDSGSI